MMVKLYRGPQHGKTYAVPDDMRTIVMHKYANRRFAYRDDIDPQATEIEKVTYSMAKVTVMIDGVVRTLPAVHPDGSVFFKYDGS